MQDSSTKCVTVDTLSVNQSEGTITFWHEGKRYVWRDSPDNPAQFERHPPRVTMAIPPGCSLGIYMAGTPIKLKKKMPLPPLPEGGEE